MICSEFWLVSLFGRIDLSFIVRMESLSVKGRGVASFLFLPDIPYNFEISIDLFLRDHELVIRERGKQRFDFCEVRIHNGVRVTGELMERKTGKYAWDDTSLWVVCISLQIGVRHPLAEYRTQNGILSNLFSF